MKPIVFLGDALEAIRAFPESARRAAGYQLERVQRGLEPDHWKPMKTIGEGVREIRVREASGGYRVLCLASFQDAVYALHAFAKKTQRTPARDLKLAAARLKQLKRRQMMKAQRFDSVWDALEASPTAAANMKARAELMIALRETIDAWKLSQVTAAKRLGLTQPRLNDLLRGRITKFSLDALMKLAGRAGLSVRVQIMRPAA